VQIGIVVPFDSVPADQLIEDGSLPAALKPMRDLGAQEEVAKNGCDQGAG
jgi:hypothetical protein